MQIEEMGAMLDRIRAVEPKPEVKKESVQTSRVQSIGKTAEQIEAVKNTIHAIAGIEYVAGEVEYVFTTAEAKGTRRAIGFRATGRSKRDKKQAIDAAVVKLHQAHNGITITVDYPEFKTGFVHLGWE